MVVDKLFKNPLPEVHSRGQSGGVSASSARFGHPLASLPVAVVAVGQSSAYPARGCSPAAPHPWAEASRCQSTILLLSCCQHWFILQQAIKNAGSGTWAPFLASWLWFRAHRPPHPHCPRHSPRSQPWNTQVPQVPSLWVMLLWRSRMRMQS